jgi:Reverse transcriptase (RNA-dependent DNA polymerase)
MTYLIKSGLSTGLLLLDVEKAFDRVWHGALLHKMLNFNFRMIWVKIIMSFLSDRTFFVTISGVRSMECDIPSGVAQGAVLSPTLFNIFTSDFPELDEVHLALFADDSALFTSHSKVDVIIGRLQTALNCLRDYYSNWRIGLNSSKTQAVFFTKRRTRELPTSELLLKDHSIP